MTEGVLVQGKPSRFRIQELDDFKSIPVDSTPHNSFNMRSRFTVTTKDIHLNINSKMLVFIKEQTKGEWVLFNNVAHSKFKIHKASDYKGNSHWSWWMNREEEEKKSHNRNDSHSFYRQKTNDESECKGSYDHNKADCKLNELINQLKSNGFLLNPIEKIKRKDLLRSASIQSKGNFQISKDEQLNIQCNGERKHYCNCNCNNQFNLQCCTALSFSFLIKG